MLRDMLSTADKLIEEEFTHKLCETRNKNRLTAYAVINLKPRPQNSLKLTYNQIGKKE